MGNEIIEMVNQALPIVADSALAVKLVDCVYKVVKMLYEPRLVFRNGKADVDVKLYEQDKLVNQNNQALTLFEINKLHNFLKAAGFAYSDLDNEEIDDDSEYSGDNMELDWVMRFFQLV